MNNNDNKRPTSLLIPKTSPFAKTKFLFATVAIIIPDSIAPITPARPAKPPNMYEIVATMNVEAK